MQFILFLYNILHQCRMLPVVTCKLSDLAGWCSATWYGEWGRCGGLFQFCGEGAVRIILADAKMILMAPPRELEETTTASPYHVAKTIWRDLKAFNLTLNEAVDLAQNRPLWRLMSTYGTLHS